MASMVVLTTLGAVGCAGTGATLTRGQLHHAAAGAVEDSLELERETSRGLDVGPELRGRVDLSEEPSIVDGSGSGSGSGSDPGDIVSGPLAFDPLLADWVGEGEEEGLEVLAVELRNACAVDFEYAFVGGEDETEDETETETRDPVPPRTLEARTAQTQVIARGDWLQLWSEGRWLASAGVTAEGASMTVDLDCETLEVEYVNQDEEAMEFAVRWTLGADRGEELEGSTEDFALDLTQIDGPVEEWASTTGDDARVELRLINYCPLAMDYSFTQGLDGEPERRSTLAGMSERQVSVPLDGWLRYLAADGSWHGGARTSFDGARMWIAENCVDFGVVGGEL